MRKTFARIHNVLAWIIFIASILQILWISMAYFDAIEVQVHAAAGFFTSVFALLMFISSLVVRVNRQNILLSLAVFLLLFPIQGLLAYSDSLPNVIQGLHGLTGMLILGLAYYLATGKYKATTYQDEVSIADSTQAVS